jgi:hypothetical protein
VEKRIKNPKHWTWSNLGNHFGIHRSVAKEIFERDMEKYASEKEIELYIKTMNKLPWKSKEKEGK